MKQFVQNSVRRHFPAVWQLHAYRRYLNAPYGEREIHFLSGLVDPARHAIDVGVHEGVYSRHLARLCRGVIGFEANPVSAAFCKAALGRSVVIHNLALSDAPGIVALRIPTAGADGSETALGTIAPSNTLGGRTSRDVQVPAGRLDDVSLPPVGFIKIDVEGHEEAVLRGASETIDRERPVLMIEIEERHNPGAVERIFTQFRQKGFQAKCVIDGALCEASSPERFVAGRPGDPDYINNFFFIPAERPFARMA